MSNLKLSYRDCYVKVAEFLGLGSNPLTTDLVKCQDLVKRGYRKFLMPQDKSVLDTRGRVVGIKLLTYRWSFLSRTSTMAIQSGIDTYKLPLGFSALIVPFTHITPLSYNPEQRSLQFIYSQKSQTTGTGYPKYFALKTGNYDQLTGQQDEVIFSPVPGASLSYYYTYTITPTAPVNDDDVFVGDDYASECILECALAAADLQENDNIGIHAQEADRLIQAAIGEDKRQNMTPNLGPMSGKDFGITRSATIYQDSIQVIPE